MYYKNNALKFECSGCGRCCYGLEDAVIEVNDAEIERIRQYLGLSPAWFRRRYLSRIGQEQHGIRIEPQGHCVFLDTVAGRCSVYSVRPLQCRTYPFWPELVAMRGAWKKEAQRCEGIGCGKTVPIAKIEANLKLLSGS